MLNEWLNDMAQEEHEKTASAQFEEVLKDMDIPELRAFLEIGHEKTAQYPEPVQQAVRPVNMEAARAARAGATRAGYGALGGLAGGGLGMLGGAALSGGHPAGVVGGGLAGAVGGGVLGHRLSKGYAERGAAGVPDETYQALSDADVAERLYDAGRISRRDLQSAYDAAGPALMAGKEDPRDAAEYDRMRAAGIAASDMQPYPYAEKVAFDPRMALSTGARGAVGGAVGGGLLGAAGGAMGAKAGQRGEGAMQGLRRGAAIGAIGGGLASGIAGGVAGKGSTYDPEIGQKMQAEMMDEQMKRIDAGDVPMGIGEVMQKMKSRISPRDAKIMQAHRAANLATNVGSIGGGYHAGATLPEEGAVAKEAQAMFAAVDQAGRAMAHSMEKQAILGIIGGAAMGQRYKQQQLDDPAQKGADPKTVAGPGWGALGGLGGSVIGAELGGAVGGIPGSVAGGLGGGVAGGHYLAKHMDKDRREKALAAAAATKTAAAPEGGEAAYRAPTTYERFMRPEGLIGEAVPLDPTERKEKYLGKTRWTVPAQAVASGGLGALIGAGAGAERTGRLSGKGALVGAGLGALAGTGLQMGARHLAAGGIQRRAEEEALTRGQKTASFRDAIQKMAAEGKLRTFGG